MRCWVDVAWCVTPTHPEAKAPTALPPRCLHSLQVPKERWVGEGRRAYADHQDLQVPEGPLESQAGQVPQVLLVQALEGQHPLQVMYPELLSTRVFGGPTRVMKCCALTTW